MNILGIAIEGLLRNIYRYYVRRWDYCRNTLGKSMSIMMIMGFRLSSPLPLPVHCHRHTGGLMSVYIRCHWHCHCHCHRIESTQATSDIMCTECIQCYMLLLAIYHLLAFSTTQGMPRTDVFLRSPHRIIVLGGMQIPSPYLRHSRGHHLDGVVQLLIEEGRDGGLGEAIGEVVWHDMT